MKFIDWIFGILFFIGHIWTAVIRNVHRLNFSFGGLHNSPQSLIA